MVFAYPAYYPGGGWSDFVCSFDTEGEAIECADAHAKGNDGGIEVIDCRTGEDIYVYPLHRGAA
jgi:hypothetical protein